MEYFSKVVEYFQILVEYFLKLVHFRKGERLGLRHLHDIL